MALLLLRLIFSALSSVANLATLVVFRGAALLVVALLKLVKVPGVAIHGALDQAAEFFKSGVVYVVELFRDAVVSLLCSCFELLSNTATGSFRLTTSAIMELLQMTKAGLEGLAQIFPEMVKGVSEIVGKIVLNLWNSYKDALEYIMKNA